MELKTEEELQEYLKKLKRHVEKTFALRSKHPNRYLIASRDRQFPFRILEDGRDVTPLPHYIPGLEYLNDEELRQSNKEIAEMSYKLFNRPIEDDMPDISMDLEKLRGIILNHGRTERLDVFYSPEQLKEWEEKKKLHKVPSMFRLREDARREQGGEQEGFIKFKETDTVFLLDIMAEVAAVGTNQAEALENDAKRISDNEIRRLFLISPANQEAFTLTNFILDRQESIQVPASTRDNASVDVYSQDMMRTMIDLGIIRPPLRKNTRLSSICYTQQTIEGLRKTNDPWRFKILEEDNETPKELEWLESLDFLKTASIVERILSANLYSNLQLMYHERLYSSKPVDDFQYTPILLWTYSCPRTYGKAVTSISWSHVDPEIFAVSYGKYLLETKVKRGLVCLWNIKNTEFPERMSILQSPVTYVEFSKTYPRIAAVSFWEGTVGLLDTVLKEPELLVKSDYEVGLLHPVWQIKWFQFEGDELLMSCGQNGEIHMFEPNGQFECRKVLTIQRVGNTVRKGIEMPQVAPNYSSPSVGPAITFMIQHPEEEKTILVSTDHGYVHVYSLFRFQDPVEVFGAHAGPVTAIEFNPLDSRIFLTAGCDFYIRIWGYGIFDTYLMELKSRDLYVDYAAWSPAHPYMIVSLSAIYMDVWNLHRQFHEPVTSIENPYQNRNILVSFNPTGANFLVGDMKGYLFVYSFTSIPKPPEDPLKKLAEAILSRLSYDDERLKLMVLKLGPPFCPNEAKMKELFTTVKKYKI